MVGFFFKRSKKSSYNFLEESRVVDPYQKQLDVFQASSQERKSSSSLRVSVKQIEDDVEEDLRDLQSYIEDVKVVSLQLEELRKMLRSGEVSESTCVLIREELGGQLSMSLEEIFRLREGLELARAKAKLEWAREKMELREFERLRNSATITGDTYMERKLYSPVRRWEEIVSKIDAALSSMPIEEETSIIEQYLSLIKEGLSVKSGSEKVIRSEALCRQRLNSISDKWASTRRIKIEQVMNLEIKSSQIKEEIEELKVRFAVGEIDQSAYEYRMSDLQGRLKKAEKEISDIRNHMDEIDMRIFRCSELLRGDS